MAPQWQVLIPVQRPDRAKTRLRPLPRESLVIAFLLDVVGAARGVADVEVVIVTPDAAVADAAQARAIVSSAPLNQALADADREVRAAHPDCAVAALVADLPAMRSQDLRLALQLATAHQRAFVSDLGGTGTTLLACTVGPLDPQFGSRSRARHRRTGAVELQASDLVRMRADVDTRVDLWYAQTLGLGPATAAALTPPDRNS